MSGAGFAGPSIWGTGLPRTGPTLGVLRARRRATAQPLPWMPGVARIVGDGFVDGQPFDACPRQVLHRAVARLAERGWQLRTGIEPEFFLLKRTMAVATRRRCGPPGQALLRPEVAAAPATFLHELQQALTACGMDVLQLDHEDAHGQYEVNFAYDDALPAPTT
jgi:glutamine synthetase